MKTFFLRLILAYTFICCNYRESKIDPEIRVDGNVSVMTSEDTAKLSRIINLKEYRPTKVKFQYTFINNSGTNERLTVPGPSDSYLQSLLYFDSVTFESVKKIYETIKYQAVYCQRKEFNFKWLDKEIKRELNSADDTSCIAVPDFVYHSPNGKIWLLRNKLLLVSESR